MELNIVELLKALSDPIRLSILKKLFSREELCACDILDDYKISQPTLSFHMKKLTQCGLVSYRKDSTWVKYKINRDLYNQLLLELESFNHIEAQACESVACSL